MIDRNIPIDGVGMQQHLNIEYINNVAEWEKTLSSNIARLVKLGLVVHITEFDVKCAEPCSKNDLQLQANVYAAALRACLANAPANKTTTTTAAGTTAIHVGAGCQSFESWGFTDKVSWLNGERCQPKAGPCHALPFDEKYQPKPAVASMLQVLET
mgnify:CR=1 FL=1